MTKCALTPYCPMKARDAYQDLLITGTGKQALLQRPVTVSGTATLQTTITLQNNPTMTVAGQTILDGSTKGTGSISSGSFDLRSGTVSALLAGGSLTKTGSGSATLVAGNTYTGDTKIEDGILSISNPYLNDLAGVYISTGAKLDLGFSSSDTIGSLYLDGASAPAGTWGATGSGAAHIDDIHFSGTGQLNVVPEPSTLVLLAAGALGLLAYAWRRSQSGSIRGHIPNPGTHYQLWYFA